MWSFASKKKKKSTPDNAVSSNIGPPSNNTPIPILQLARYMDHNYTKSIINQEYSFGILNCNSALFYVSFLIELITRGISDGSKEVFSVLEARRNVKRGSDVDDSQVIQGSPRAVLLALFALKFAHRSGRISEEEKFLLKQSLTNNSILNNDVFNKVRIRMITVVFFEIDFSVKISDSFRKASKLPLRSDFPPKAKLLPLISIITSRPTILFI